MLSFIHRRLGPHSNPAISQRTGPPCIVGESQAGTQSARISPCYLSYVTLRLTAGQSCPAWLCKTIVCRTPVDRESLVIGTVWSTNSASALTTRC